jgi:hypothetical protein
VILMEFFNHIAEAWSAIFRFLVLLITNLQLFVHFVIDFCSYCHPKAVGCVDLSNTGTFLKL